MQIIAPRRGSANPTIKYMSPNYLPRIFNIVETTTSSSLADTSSGCKHEEETRGGGKGVKMMMSALWEEGGEDLDQYLV